jgi:hypothetical protein
MSTPADLLNTLISESNFGYCQRCEKYQFLPEKCSCQLFYCWYEDLAGEEDEMHQVYARDPEEVAVLMAKDWFDDSLSGVLEPIDIFVKRPDASTLTRYTVEIGVEVTYNARVSE